MAGTTGVRTRVTRVATWVVVALVAVLGTEIGLAATQSPAVRAPSPVQLLQEALIAARTADAFHYRAVWSTDGFSQIVEGDALPTSGKESVSVGGDRFTVVVTEQMAYLEGNAASLRDQLGLPAATALANAGKWISLQQSDGPYPSVNEGLTTSAALAQVAIAPSSTEPVHHTRTPPLSRIKGKIPHGQMVTGSAQLDLISRSKLPALYSAHGAGGGEPWTSTIAFSHWGEKVAVDAPTGARPFSSLQGAVPSSSRTPAT